MSPAVIGIDLGTTYSCVGVIKNEKVQIVTNHNSKRVTASVVSFQEAIDEEADYDILIGEDARDRSEITPETTIFCVKRLMGRTWDDPTLREDLRMWPFKVVDVNGKPKYQMDVNNKTHTFFPEEISAQILGRMKSMAEDFLGDTVSGAVITVPAYFNENQKLATRAAAQIAGLEILDLLSEPTAAAIAYGVDLQEKAARTVLVFDFGGGTFDVSVIKISGEDITVLAIDGDSHLGGEDIDNNLALYFEEMFNRKHNTQLRADNSRAWRRLKDRCEKLKIQLSRLILGNLRLDRIHEGKDLNASLTRSKLEEINDDLFRKAISITEQVIIRSKVKKEAINDVLLVGGSTRIPKIKILLQNLLPNSRMPETLDADEAVAVGATILAAEKTDCPLERDVHVKLWNVLPQSLGIGTGRGLMHTFIERDTTVPVKETIILSTEKDNQNLIRFKVFEGENKDTSKNYYLGEFRIAGIPPAPRGGPQIEVTFSVNEECLLEVTAEDLATSRSKGLKLHYNHDRLTKDELEVLRTKYQKFEKHDKEVRARLLALEDLEEFAKSVRTTCLKDNFRNKVPADITRMVNEIYDWIDQWHKDQSYPTVQKTEEKKKELKDLWDPFIMDCLKKTKTPQHPVLLA